MATPGLPNNPDNYMVPSELSIWFAPRNDDGTLQEYFDLGNVMDISLALTDTYLDHMSARNGLLAPDKSVITQVDGDVKFTLDEMVYQNLVLAFKPAITPNTSATYVVQGQKRLRLNDTTAVIIDRRAVELDEDDYLELDNIVVRSADGTTTYVDTTDYTFTQAAGTGTARTPASIARSGTASAIVDGAEVVVNYTFSRATTSYQLQSGAFFEGAMKVQAYNLIGPMFAYYFPKVSIRTEGETAINPNEWMKQAFTCKILTAGDGSRGEFHLFDRFLRLSV